MVRGRSSPNGVWLPVALWKSCGGHRLTEGPAKSAGLEPNNTLVRGEPGLPPREEAEQSAVADGHTFLVTKPDPRLGRHN